MSDSHCNFVEHAELIKNRVPKCSKCGQELCLAPKRCEHGCLIPAGCEYCRPDRKPDKRLSRIAIAEEIEDIRVEKVIEANEDPDADDAKESSEENDEPSTDDEVFEDDFED
jgi:hypothetical protein